MKAIVIYDSVFGNTEQVAQAIGGALSSIYEVKVSKPGAVRADQLTGIELLVVGSPTRSFSATPEIMTFLASLGTSSLKGVKVAAFDTRMDMKDIPFFFRGMVSKGGFAAPLIAKTLEQKGGTTLVPPEGFFVKDREGPMKKDEVERAAEWAKKLIS